MKALFRFLISVAFVFLPATQAQNTTTVSIPFRRTFSLSVLSSPLSLNLPAQDSPYSLSVALCGAVLPYPRFFVSNESGVTLPGPDGARGSQGGSELSLDQGLVTYESSPGTASVFAIWPSSGAGANWTLDVAVVDGTSPLHQRMTQLPLLGDTTATQAIIFSSPFLVQEFTEPTYPNYTFQAVIPSISSPSSSLVPNSTLLLFPTANADATVWLTNSACALTTKLGGVITTKISRTVLRDETGWRRQWFVDGLSASTNYTAYVIEEDTRVSGPSFFLTKSESFPCPLVHSLPYCPEVTYTVPLPAPPGGATSYTNENLPQSIQDVAVASLSNFTASLRTFPCGRDWYSRLQSCTGCQTAYRKWLCSVVFPRCGEPISDESLAVSASSSNNQNGSDPALEPLPQAALIQRPANATPRSSFLPTLNVVYNELLPCMETCYIVDRSCPPMLTWKCPSVWVNANTSYGLGFIDSWDGTIEGGGRPGAAQDEFGRVWCNG
ncbi:Stretch-activated Ca2+-permeable channel component [Ceratobasidium theobromae]|uniref:Stretch-activated Ca2+-permeable channel component n=1 Tax=Ceratobasidium theobromae TaxID=1582974 RepID=A0A5N5QEB8_9AGAM|nr:Stretch-activated Ca2+-permeable channel component [Ceratobasidium theobromae]